VSVCAALSLAGVEQGATEGLVNAVSGIRKGANRQFHSDLGICCHVAQLAEIIGEKMWINEPSRGGLLR
jgi:hypothetical protein